MKVAFIFLSVKAHDMKVADDERSTEQNHETTMLRDSVIRIGGFKAFNDEQATWSRHFALSPAFLFLPQFML